MMDIRSKRVIRHQVRKDLVTEMNRLGLNAVEFRIPDAIDYICMVNDIEFDGKYEYTGENWVRDTIFNYPNYFGLSY